VLLLLKAEPELEASLASVSSGCVLLLLVALLALAVAATSTQITQVAHMVDPALLLSSCWLPANSVAIGIKLPITGHAAALL